MKLEYHKNGDYFIPNLALSEQPTQPIGKYGRMRQRYLQGHHAAGITAKLKATDQMKWVGLMSAVKAQVEEFIFSELIYT